MRKNVTLCLVSAVLGAALSVALWNPPHAASQLTAAEPPPLPGPQFARRRAERRCRSLETAPWRRPFPSGRQLTTI